MQSGCRKFSTSIGRSQSFTLPPSPMSVSRSKVRFSIIKTTLQEALPLFREMLRYRTIPIVFSSTCATYGIPSSIPIPEEHPQHPISPYGFTKLAVERLLDDLGRAHGLTS